MTATEFNYRLLTLQKNLIKFAYKLTEDKDDAEDLLQETYLKALKCCNQFVDESNFEGWTFTIMKHTFINNYRRSIRQNAFRDTTNDHFFINQSRANCSDNPDSIFSEKEIAQNIENLHEMYREPFKMHIYGFSYKEISQELNLPIGTIKSRIFVSRKKLMTNLSE